MLQLLLNATKPAQRVTFPRYLNYHLQSFCLLRDWKLYLYCSIFTFEALGSLSAKASKWEGKAIDNNWLRRLCVDKMNSGCSCDVKFFTMYGWWNCGSDCCRCQLKKVAISSAWCCLFASYVYLDCFHNTNAGRIGDIVGGCCQSKRVSVVVWHAHSIILVNDATTWYRTATVRENVP